jgi:D-serine deaminase-like pyridoxal phosphate-dependent protein
MNSPAANAPAATETIRESTTEPATHNRSALHGRPETKVLGRFDLDTPALVLDLSVLDRNIAWLASFFRERGIAWRPHAKSYQCTRLAQRVVQGGAIGVTCAKLGEAEAFAAVGIHDLLITCPLVGASKMERLAALRRVADPIAVVDHVDHVVALDAAGRAAGTPIRALIELNLGMNRCGVEPGEPAVALARYMAAAPGVAFTGLMGWEGHLLTIADPAEKRDKIHAALTGLTHTRDLLMAAGLPCPIVSAGGTGSFPISASTGQLTEIQAGGAVLMDLFYRHKCHIEPLEFALTLMATVTSRPTATRAVLDMGRKSLNPELHLPAIKDRDDLRVQWLSAEHGVLEVLTPPGPAIGERLELIPGYGDWSTLLHDRYYVFEGERFVETWPLDVRTKTS